MSRVQIVRTIAEIREALEPHRPSSSGRIGLVPTMGAFHAGHRSLMAAARAECAVVVVSLFVNPAQFGPGEDLARYPRDEAHDVGVATEAGVDLLFVPPAEEIYPPGFATWVQPGALAETLEGAVRPGHFRGVATVCLKLFEIVRPRVAYFGRKDAQQAEVITRLVRDLDLELDVRVLPTIRDPDGLALSSRNAYLSPAERATALALPRALQLGLAAYRRGEDPVAATCAILEAQDGLVVDYVAAADLGGQTLAAAVRVGTTRLIDNVLLTEADP